MPIEKKNETTDEETTPALTREDVQAMVNGAFKDAQKRTEKIVESALAKFADALPKPAESTEQVDSDPKGKASSASWKDSAEYRALQKQLADTQKRVEESEKRAAAEADARRQDAAKGSLRRAFEAANVRPEALDVLVAAATVNGMLRYDEDGKPLVAVKRSRSKGASADEQTFDDFGAAVADWKLSPEAAAFLKPTQGATPGALNGNRSTTPSGQIKTFAKPPATDEEALERVVELMNQNATTG